MKAGGWGGVTVAFHFLWFHCYIICTCPKETWGFCCFCLFPSSYLSCFSMQSIHSVQNMCSDWIKKEKQATMQHQGLIGTVFIHCKEIFWGFDGISRSDTNWNLCKYELTWWSPVLKRCCFTDGGTLVVTALLPWDAAERNDYSWF